MPQFTALSGSELKSVILDKISRAMDESGDFNNNITYPWLRYSYELKMTSYPKFAFDAELQPVVKVEDEIKDPLGAPENLVPSMDDVKETVLVSEPMTIDTPDQARVDADLPLPTPTPVVNIGVVDKMVMQKSQPPMRGKGK